MTRSLPRMSATTRANATAPPWPGMLVTRSLRPPGASAPSTSAVAWQVRYQPPPGLAGAMQEPAPSVAEPPEPAGATSRRDSAETRAAAPERPGSAVHWRKRQHDVGGIDRAVVDRVVGRDLAPARSK